MPRVEILLAALLSLPLCPNSVLAGGANASLAAPARVAYPVLAPDGNAILAAADDRAAAFKDQKYVASMEIRRGGKTSKTLEFDMSMRGLEKQLIVFRAPGDVAGMKVLMQDAQTLYVYSPEFKKVRRIAAHMQNQGFLGSTFTYEDMTGLRLSARYDAKLGGRSGSKTTLALTAKPGTKPTYPTMEVVIDASVGAITTLRYFDGSGAQVREQTRGAWKPFGKLKIPTNVTMKNLKTGDETVITLANVQVDTGIPDSTFSRRTLMRGT